MPGISAGLLLYRKRDRWIEVFLIHPGGPFWEKKDLGSWSIPKGLVEEDEDLLDAAKREFHEETGFKASGPFMPLSPVKLKNGKTVYAWAAEGDVDPGAMKSNTFTMEWPPRSGRQQIFPEADRGAWYTLDDAERKITTGQVSLLEEFRQRIIPDKHSKD